MEIILCENKVELFKVKESSVYISHGASKINICVRNGTQKGVDVIKNDA
jgi:hypothetical protein